MHIIEVDHGLELSKATLGYVRTPGVHMSDIYNLLYKKLDPKRYDKRDDEGRELPFSKMHAEFGTIYEEALEIVLKSRHLGNRPGEMRTDHAKDCPHRKTKMPSGVCCPCGGGVYYSPDYLFAKEPDGVLRLGEFKATWRSIGKGIRDPKFDKWFCQVMAYLYHLGMTEAKLVVMFVIIDKASWQPDVKAWNISFSNKELVNNWDMLLRFARKHHLLEAA